MKNLAPYLIGIFLVVISCKGQNKAAARTYYNKDFKWTIEIPAGLDTVSAEKWEQMQGRGMKAMEEHTGTQIENRTKTLFVLQYDQMNYFESNTQPFNEAADGNYLENSVEVNKMAYGTFESQMPGTKLDSASSTTVIDGLTFQTFKVNIHLPSKKVLKWTMFNRLFNNRELTVNIMAVDSEKEKELLKAWTNSKFEK